MEINKILAVKEIKDKIWELQQQINAIMMYIEIIEGEDNV